MKQHIGHIGKVSLGILLFGWLAACAIPAMPTPGSVTRVTFLPPASNQQYYESLAETFNAQHASVRVEVLQALDVAPIDPRQDIAARFAAVAGIADVFAFPDLAPEVTAPSGLVQDLRPLVEADPSFTPDDTVSPLLSGYEHVTGLWGIPLYLAAPVVYYDEALVAASGAPVPGPDWSWQEFLALAQRISRPQETFWGFMDFQANAATSFVYLNGGQLASDGSPTFNNSSTAQAWSWYAGLARDHGVMPDSGQDCGGNQSCARVAGMWVGATTDPTGTGTGVLPLPRNHPQGTVPVWPETLYLSARARNADAAWLWITYLTHQLPPAGRLPVRTSVFTSALYRAQLDEQTYRTYEAILARMALSPWRHPELQATRVWLIEEGLPALLQGEITVETLLQDAQARGERSAQASIPSATPAPPDSGPTVGHERAVEIAYRMGQRSRALEALMVDFHEAHPEIRLRLKAQPADRLTTTIEDLANGVDVVGVWPGCEAVSAQLFLDLLPLVDSDSEFRLDDFYPVAVAPYQSQGRLWALPHELQAYMLFYNKKVFDAAGLPYPTAGWSWDDLLATAKQLTQAAATPPRWGLGLHFSDWTALPMLLAAQGQACTYRTEASDVQDSPRLDTPALAGGLQWTLDLARVYQVMPEPSLDFVTFGEGSERFQNGTVAMVIATQRSLGYHIAERDEKVDLGVAPLPVDGCPATAYFAIGHAITAETAHPRAAWAWLTYLNRHVSTIETWPARRSQAHAALFPTMPDSVREELRDAYTLTLKAYQDAASVLWSDSMHQDVIDRLYAEAVRSAWELDATPESALAQAQRKWEVYLACVGDTVSRERITTCTAETHTPEWHIIFGVRPSP
jgi:multiple sugar transport system substrate-binding protein